MGEQTIGPAEFLNDVTVVLLGQGDERYSGRSDHYYRARFLHHVLVDVSLQGSPSSDWQAHLIAALEQVTTPFTVLTLDCDFLLAGPIAAQVATLQEKNQCQMVQGYSLGYLPGNSEVAYYRIGAGLKAKPQACSIRESIELHAIHGLQAWRSVVRTGALKAALRSSPSDLPFDAWLAALSYALLAQGPSQVLEHTSAIIEYRAWVGSQVAREEQLTRTVRVIRQWDEQHGGVCADADGFEILDAFVRRTQNGGEAPLLFTSCWTQITGEPERKFEPRQFVEMPYYNAPLFELLRGLEFLMHAWPAGQAQSHVLEGTWVRQQQLLTAHPNDTAESLKARYWQAFTLGLFNPQVCQSLLASLVDEQEQQEARELKEWLKHLTQLQGPAIPRLLAATPSGKVLAAISAATPDAMARRRVVEHLGRVRSPQMAFVVIDLDGNDEALQNTFDSLLSSGLRNFKIVVLRSGSLPAITTAKDTLHFIKVSAENFVAHLNQVVRQLPSEWLLLLKAGDEFTTGGLLRLQVELPGAEACHAICANEVQRDDDGRLLSVVRPGCNLDLLRSRPDLMSRHWLVRRESVVALGGYNESYAAALEFDLLLRMVEQNGIAGLAHLDDYLVIAAPVSKAIKTDALATLKRHLNVLGYRSQISEVDGAFRIDFRHSTTPQVSILLSVDSDLEQLKACLASIVQRTRFSRYEVLVLENPANAQATAAALSTVQGLGARVKIFMADSHCSRSELVNQAATQAQGQYLVLMSSSSEVVSPAWIDALLNHAQRPEVGVVGAKLIDRAGLVAHAGYELLGIKQVKNVWQGASDGGAATALGLASDRSCQAVSGNCLMLSKVLFEQCGGLSAGEGADIDLCLKIVETGHLVMCTPFAQMLGAAIPALGAEASHALAARWPAAFVGRVTVDVQHAVDVSRTPVAGSPVALEWLAEIE